MTDQITGASRGFGFVRFNQEQDCLRALDEMQGVVITPSSGGPGRPLRVCTATPKNRNAANTGAISQQALTESLLRHAQSHATTPYPASSRSSHPLNAPLLSPLSTAMPPQLQLASQRPASPTLASSSAYARSTPTQSTFGALAISTPSSTLPTSTSALDPNNTTVFVGGLSSLISEDTLKSFFQPFGEITYVKIPPGKGCGFVQFVRKADAERAIERMQGFPAGGGRIRLSWGRSQGDKAAAAAAQAAASASHLRAAASLVGLESLTQEQLTVLGNLGSALSASATGRSPIDVTASFFANKQDSHLEAESFERQRQQHKIQQQLGAPTLSKYVDSEQFREYELESKGELGSQGGIRARQQFAERPFSQSMPSMQIQQHETSGIESLISGLTITSDKARSGHESFERERAWTSPALTSPTRAVPTFVPRPSHASFLNTSAFTPFSPSASPAPSSAGRPENTIDSSAIDASASFQHQPFQRILDRQKEELQHQKALQQYHQQQQQQQQLLQQPETGRQKWPSALFVPDQDDAPESKGISTPSRSSPNRAEDRSF